MERPAGLPAPLGELSPWLDHLVEPRQHVFARLDAQTHRRVIKTHTPLDGVPIDPRATYVVVARHPLDAAVSLYHQGENLNRERLHQLTGADTTRGQRPPLRDWLAAWIDDDPDPVEALDSLPGVLWHLSDAWARSRADQVVLVHYGDLLAELSAEMRRLAGLLGIAPAPERWDELVHAATLDAMRARADELAPDSAGVLRDARAFFREGRSGGGALLLDPAQLQRYHDRAAALAPPDLLAWLHR